MTSFSSVTSLFKFQLVMSGILKNEKFWHLSCETCSVSYKWYLEALASTCVDCLYCRCSDT